MDVPPSLTAKLANPIEIGTVIVRSRVLQSPLSGVTDLVFRRLVRRYAPQSMIYTEMVRASDLHHLQSLPKIMNIDPNEQPISIQLFDGRPDFMAEAAQKAVAAGQTHTLLIDLKWLSGKLCNHSAKISDQQYSQ